MKDKDLFNLGSLSHTKSGTHVSYWCELRLGCMSTLLLLPPPTLLLETVVYWTIN